ncbi:MAG: capsular biosynthesis protein CpsI, partial [Bacteroidota bacterium]|nr:capsular biosynthesis protein CpsI [Bacteroidota bacterium]
DAMGKNAIIDFKPVQPGDMMATNASSDKLFNYTGFRPETSIQHGVGKMVEWFNSLDPALRKMF